MIYSSMVSKGIESRRFLPRVQPSARQWRDYVGAPHYSPRARIHSRRTSYYVKCDPLVILVARYSNELSFFPLCLSLSWDIKQIPDN